MTTSRTGRFHERKTLFRRAGLWVLALIVLLPALAALPGCSGCNKDPAAIKAELEKAEAERKKKEAEKPKDDFEKDARMGTIPSNRLAVLNYCKPGHWTSSALVGAKANNFDFLGDMEIGVEDGQSHLVPLMATPFELTTFRQVSLPKGQEKTLDSVFFVPPDAQKSFVVCKVTGRGGGRTAIDTRMIASRMPSYQYHFVVLARIPEQYSFLDRDRFYCFKPFFKDIDNNLLPYYHVSFVNGVKRPDLPPHAMLWTSIACILWDDASPVGFDLTQQQSLLDWLHWGGQIIISGPDTLDTLKGSFLEPYLPAVSGGAREISAADLAEINAFSDKPIGKLAPAKAWTGVKLDRHPQAAFVPNSGELLTERRIGRGRVVVSAFRLSDRAFTTWPGVDEFFNACLLRHPPRKFVENENTEVRALRKDGREDRDAADITGLRYFSRDEGLILANYAPDLNGPRESNRSDFRNPFYSPPDVPDLANMAPLSGPGIAAWNDFSPAAARARSALLSAARIEIPKRSFVVTVLAVYLAFLVPLNWCVFRALGRVEWAWAAAPAIAIVCTGVVIKLAQLDIGFVRSRTEIGVLEIQPDYARAHLTRYNALYTSLSTPYDFTFADAGAAALPFPTVEDPSQFALVAGQERRSLRYVHGEEAMLQGVPISSNSTTLMHSEEVFPLGGKLSLVANDQGRPQIVNHTKLAFQGVGLIEKDHIGNLRTAWIGMLEPEDEKTVDWVPQSGTGVEGRLWANYRDRYPLTKSYGTGKPPPGELSLHEMLNLSEKRESIKAMRPGEVKMVAWMDEELPGLKISPSSAQSRHAVMVVGHLSYGEDPAPQPDENLPKDAKNAVGPENEEG